MMENQTIPCDIIGFTINQFIPIISKILNDFNTLTLGVSCRQIVLISILNIVILRRTLHPLEHVNNRLLGLNHLSTRDIQHSLLAKFYICKCDVCIIVYRKINNTIKLCFRSTFRDINIHIKCYICKDTQIVNVSWDFCNFIHLDSVTTYNNVGNCTNLREIVSITSHNKLCRFLCSTKTYDRLNLRLCVTQSKSCTLGYSNSLKSSLVSTRDLSVSGNNQILNIYLLVTYLSAFTLNE